MLQEVYFSDAINGYIYPVTARLSGYCDAQRWAIIIECFGYSPRGGDHDGATNCLHVYGNCLEGEPGPGKDTLCVTEDGPEGPTFDDWTVLPEAESIKLRGEVIKFDLSDAALEANGITKVEDDLTATDLFRSLLPDYREKLLARDGIARANPSGSASGDQTG